MYRKHIIKKLECILLNDVNNYPQKNSIKEYQALYENEILKNFSRLEFYNEILLLIDKHENNNDMLNELYEIELTILGHCSEFGIKSFIDEPDDRETLVAYVRSLTWQKAM